MPLIIDSFDAANANPIGGNWATLPGTVAHQRYNGTAISATGAGAVSRYTGPERLSANQFIQFVIVDPSGAVGSVGGILARGADGTITNASYSLLVAVRAGGLALELWKWLNGVQTALSAVFLAVQPGDLLRLELNGPMLRATHIRNQVVTTVFALTDGSVTGNLGSTVAMQTSGPMSLDDFQAGDLLLAPTAVILGPLYATEVAAFGVATPGATVEVWKNGMALTPVVTADAKGRWIYTSAMALAQNDVLKVRERRTDGLFTAFSGSVTVLAAANKPPSVDEPLYAGCTDITGSGKPGATKVTVYRNGGSIGDTVPTATGRFRLTAAAHVAGQRYTAKQTVTVTQSAASDEVIAKTAPADTDAYKTKVFALLDAFDFVRATTDSEDIRRGIASVLEAAALEGLGSHQIDNGMLFLAAIQALNIWYVNN